MGMNVEEWPFWAQLEAVADRWQLDPYLVAAIVTTESGGDPTAVRYEPGYRWLFIPKKVKPSTCSLPTERMLQKTSFGLMQVMGAVARERGLEGFITELCFPVVGLEYGCAHLAKHIKRFRSVERGVSAYNQGSPRKNDAGHFENQPYVDKVMTLYRRYLGKVGE